ncbi:uncharacterized protein LY89DRAFT_642471 [Mollisia scopiformis]|uniref:Secreted protein n=1 Tax=Mollisia scopiformis TaxID=149040 RepID=A0A194XI32_MOLSC|nr:uncharacterized protein LY89DRAFT_642471 [Mollisia scopiformis]KUJ19422.1 hypothetical protein LY89DRAFT_642471 [Mollisia scopiformis]
MFSALLTLALAVAALAAPAPTSPAPPAGQVSIKSITYGGTGCPQGSVGSFISDDKQTFTLIFDNYVASIGPGVAVTENRKNCQINLDLSYPSGFQYSVFNTVYRGYVGIDAGVTARQQSTFYFSGQSAQCSTGTNFSGPKSGDYSVTDSLPLTSVVWSPCGASTALNINSQVRLASTSTSGTGQITDDSVDGKITFVVGVQWQTC